MTMTMALVSSGRQHAVSSGTLSAGAAVGEITGTGTNMLLRLVLPFSGPVWRAGRSSAQSQDQTYVTFKSLDGNVTNVTLDATQFEETNSGPAIRLRVDAVALPATVECQVECHHSIGR